jgi:hypothetical protein
VIYSVSERQIPVFARDGFAEGKAFCRLAERSNVPCLNLAPVLHAASAGGHPALFVDGAHFTAAGSRLAAQRIADFLR